jgi:peptidyl-prolyl cis-trans isomerase SDCCAG10
MLDAFTSKLTAFSNVSTETDTASSSSTRAKQVCELHQVVDCESCVRQTNHVDDDNESNLAAEAPNEFIGETWDEQGWLSHHLTFEKDTKGKDLMKKRDNIDDYVVIDPRVRDAQAKRLDKYDRPSSTRRYSDHKDKEADYTRHRHRR